MARKRCSLLAMALRRSLAAAAALFALAVPSLAHAEGPEEESDFSPYEQLLLLGFEDEAVDTGWIPANSPVQMRFFAAASNSVTMSLPGAAHYDWRTEQLRFEGDENAGYFAYDVGLEIFASVKVDLDIVQWESDLLGPYDWAIDASTMFTPYLLEGNPDRPAMIMDTSGALPLASVPIVPDIVIIAGNLDIDLYVDIAAQLQCNRIEVVGTDGELTDFTIENESLWMNPGEGPDDVVLPATAYCQLQTQPTLIINPHLVLEVLFDEYDIAGIDIPIPLPVIDDEQVFDTIDLSFPYWEAPSDDGGETDTGDDGDGGSESGDDGGDEIGDDGTGDTGTGDAGGIGEDDGCNCSTTDDHDGRGWLGLGLFAGLLGFGATRRRHRQRRVERH